jgi:hypothetical protein
MNLYNSVGNLLNCQLTVTCLHATSSGTTNQSISDSSSGTTINKDATVSIRHTINSTNKTSNWTKWAVVTMEIAKKYGQN